MRQQLIIFIRWINLRGKLTFILIILCLSVTFVTPPLEGGSQSPPSSSPPRQSVQSEEENIDSWDVHPASGRWNITDDDINDQIDDSLFILDDVNNETSGSNAYEMNRGLRKTDGKIEYRMNAAGAGNQSEFFRDSLGDKCDFEEDDEGFTLAAGGTISNADGLLIVEDDSVDDVIVKSPLISVSSIVYSNWSLKVKANVSTEIYLMDVGLATVSDALTVTTSWTEFNIDISIDSDWSGLETQLNVYVAHVGSNIKFEMDWLELIGELDYATHTEDVGDTWDFEEGDDETWINFFDILTITAANSWWNGTTGSVVSAGTKNVNLNIPAENFYLSKIRFNSTKLIDSVTIIDNDSNSVGAVSAGYAADTIHEITMDLSTDSDWTGTELSLAIQFDWTGAEVLTIMMDYVLLLGHWSNVSSTIGLYDSNAGPLVNVSMAFTSNDNHSSTSDYMRFEMDLIDEAGDIAYSFFSDYFSDVNGEFIRGKITYDVLRSNLAITLTADNGTRFDKITYPQDYTEGSGRIPLLFVNEKPPEIFFSVITDPIAWQETQWDYVRAPFKEREWVQTTAPTDADWLSNSPFFAYIQDDIDDVSVWQLNVPSLDTISGSLTSEINDSTALAAGEGIIFAIGILGVDADDGDIHLIGSVQILQGKDLGGNSILTITIFVHGGLVFDETHEVATNPRIAFSMFLSNDRSDFGIKTRIWFDKEDETIFSDYMGNVSVSDAVTVPSQEFIIGITYTASFNGNTFAKMLVEDFGFVERDIFSDIIDAVVQPIGNFISQIFTAAFRFLAGIFRAVGDVIVLGIGIAIATVTAGLLTLQTALTSAIGQIEGWLTTIATTISNAIGNIEGWLTTIATTISNAIGDIEGWLTSIATTISEAVAALAADFWAAFSAAAADFVDDIITALTALASDFADFLDSMIQFLIPLLIALASDFADWITSILDIILPWLGAFLVGAVDFFINLGATILFGIWGALGLPDVLAVIGDLLTGLNLFITNLPQFIADFARFLDGASALFVVAGFVWIFIVPIAQGDTIGEWFTCFLDRSSDDITFGMNIMGIGVSVPVILPWLVITVFTVLLGTTFSGFF